MSIQQQNRVDMAIEPKSDQINYDDFLINTKNITVTGVTSTGNAADQQPVSVHFKGDNGKPFKPCKSMRRVMVRVWGDNPAEYVGKSMTLYGDTEVIFGGKKVGGIRISHMSHIDKEVLVPLSASKTKRMLYRVEPLKVEASAGVEPVEPVDIESQAKKGMDAYKACFASLSKAEKNRIDKNGDHDRYKQMAEDADNVPEDDEDYFPGDK